MLLMMIIYVDFTHDINKFSSNEITGFPFFGYRHKNFIWNESNVYYHHGDQNLFFSSKQQNIYK